MTALVVLPVVLPLISASLSIMVGRVLTAQRVIGVTTLSALVASSVALLIHVDANGAIAVQVGGWAAPIGITLVVDRLAAIMMAVASTMFLAVLIYAIGQPGAERNHVGFQSVYLILASGVSLSFLTGDLFTLFVGFEMMLTASYVLITLGARPQQVRAGMTYVVISLIASTLFLSGIALVYMSTGTVNMADLAGKIPQLSPALQSLLSVWLLMAIGIKAGLFPLFFWLPDSYPTAPSAVTAIFAGLLTKVAVYAIIRTQSLFFPTETQPAALLLWIAGATMFVGVLGAIAQTDVKRILSFHSVSQIGYMVMGLALFSVAGIAAAVFYIVHYIIVKTALFLVGGLIEYAGGTGQLNRVGSMARTAPFLGVLFLVPALSLAGIPPLSGFVAKFSLVSASTVDQQWWIAIVAIVVSLLTLFSMMKIWSGVFWSPREFDPDVEPQPVTKLGGPIFMVLPTAVLAVLSLLVSVFASSLYDFSERTAEDLMRPTTYVEVVMIDE